MRYMTATRAASILGKSEKTVRRWIQEGKLQAHHPKPNQLAIAESDVERLKRELAQYESQSENVHTQEPEQEERTQERTQDIASLVARIEQLEQDRASLVARIEQLERERVQVTTEPTENASPARAERTTPHERTPRQRAATTSTEDAIPAQGAMQFADFARMYNVPRSTFRDHITKGIGRGEEKEKVLVFSRPKPNRPEGENEYWILPEQVQSVLDYWQRHNVKFTLPARESSEEEQERNT